MPPLFVSVPKHDLTRILGISLIRLGFVGLAIGGISYTTEETVADVAPRKW